MNFQQLLYILRARLRTILTALAVTVVTSVIINLLLPKSYEASTTLVVSSKAPDPLSGAMLPESLISGYVATQADIIQSTAVALAVVDALRLTEVPSLKTDFERASEENVNQREWIANLLLKHLNVMPELDSGVITVKYTDVDPVFAAAVVNGFAAEYQRTTVRLKVQPIKQASVYFNAQVKGLRGKLEQTQARLSRYRQEKGVVNLDSQLDIEMARLKNLSSQLVMSEGQMADATSRQSATGAAAESPDVIGNNLIQNLKLTLARAESKVSELSARLDVNHPDYRSAKAEVTKLRAELDEQIKLTYGSLGNNSRISQRREAELRAAVAAQKTRILELNREHNELSALMRDVDSAQRTYDAAITRVAQTSMEGGANVAEVAVLSPAMPPTTHSSPRILLNIVLAIIFGGAFGIGIAILMELIRRRVHSTQDLLELQVPILAEFNWSNRLNPQSGSGKPSKLP